jgi:hypothetical protein
VLCQVIQIVVSIRDREKNRDLTGDPWGGRTLEWATSSPPPFYNFAIEPKVRVWTPSGKPRLTAALTAACPVCPIHMPKNSGAGVIIAAFSVVFGFAMIWHIWWMAIAGFVGMIATWIIHSFNDDVDYYVQVDEIERIEVSISTISTRWLNSMATDVLHHSHGAHEDGHHDAGATKVFGFWIYLMTDCILFATLFATYAVWSTALPAARWARTSSNCRSCWPKPCCCC